MRVLQVEKEEYDRGVVINIKQTDEARDFLKAERGALRIVSIECWTRGYNIRIVPPPSNRTRSHLQMRQETLIRVASVAGISF